MRRSAAAALSQIHVKIKACTPVTRGEQRLFKSLHLRKSDATQIMTILTTEHFTLDPEDFSDIGYGVEIPQIVKHNKLKSHDCLQ